MEEQVEETEIWEEIFDLEEDNQYWKEKVEDCKVNIKRNKTTIKWLKRKIYKLQGNEEGQND